MSLAQVLPIASNNSAPTDVAVESLIHVGSGTLAQNSESGAIMRVLLNEPGFKTRITDGVAAGHNYTIIHMPGSPNFILCDTWQQQGKRETRYQSFVIATTDLSPQSRLSEHTTIADVQAPDPVSAILDDVERSLDELLTLVPARAA